MCYGKGFNISYRNVDCLQVLQMEQKRKHTVKHPMIVFGINSYRGIQFPILIISLNCIIHLTVTQTNYTLPSLVYKILEFK